MTDPYGRKGRAWVAPGRYADEIAAAKKRHPSSRQTKGDPPHMLTVIPQDHDDTCTCWSCAYVDAHIDDHDDTRPEDL